MGIFLKDTLASKDALVSNDTRTQNNKPTSYQYQPGGIGEDLLRQAREGYLYDLINHTKRVGDELSPGYGDYLAAQRGAELYGRAKQEFTEGEYLSALGHASESLAEDLTLLPGAGDLLTIGKIWGHGIGQIPLLLAMTMRNQPPPNLQKKLIDAAAKKGTPERTLEIADEGADWLRTQKPSNPDVQGIPSKRESTGSYAKREPTGSYRDEFNRDVYHASQQDIKEFKPGYDDGLVFVALEPRLANEWAGKGKYRGRIGTKDEIKRLEDEYRAAKSESFDWDRLAELEGDEFNKAYDEMNENFKSKNLLRPEDAYKTIYPLKTNVKNTFNAERDYKKIEPFLRELRLDDVIKQGQHKTGNWVIYERKDVVDKLKEMGYDSMLIAENIDGPQETLAIFDAKNLRSRFAGFDPAKADSPDIMSMSIKDEAGIQDDLADAYEDLGDMERTVKHREEAKRIRSGESAERTGEPTYDTFENEIQKDLNKGAHLGSTGFDLEGLKAGRISKDEFLKRMKVQSKQGKTQLTRDSAAQLYEKYSSNKFANKPIFDFEDSLRGDEFFDNSLRSLSERDERGNTWVSDAINDYRAGKKPLKYVLDRYQIAIETASDGLVRSSIRGRVSKEHLKARNLELAQLNRDYNAILGYAKENDTDFYKAYMKNNYKVRQEASNVRRLQIMKSKSSDQSMSIRGVGPDRETGWTGASHYSDDQYPEVANIVASRGSSIMGKTRIHKTLTTLEGPKTPHRMRAALLNRADEETDPGIIKSLREAAKYIDDNAIKAVEDVGDTKFAKQDRPEKTGAFTREPEKEYYESVFKGGREPRDLGAMRDEPPGTPDMGKSVFKGGREPMSRNVANERARHRGMDIEELRKEKDDYVQGANRTMRIEFDDLGFDNSASAWRAVRESLRDGDLVERWDVTPKEADRLKDMVERWDAYYDDLDKMMYYPEDGKPYKAGENYYDSILDKGRTPRSLEKMRDTAGVMPSKMKGKYTESVFGEPQDDPSLVYWNDSTSRGLERGSAYGEPARPLKTNTGLIRGDLIQHLWGLPKEARQEAVAAMRDVPPESLEAELGRWIANWKKQ